MRLESVVCWRWKPAHNYRSIFGPETVNTLRRMVLRNYRADVRFICVTDDPAGLDPAVEVVPLWDDFAAVPSPHGPKNPSCYRRLRAFSADVAPLLGRRFASIDLDTVITGDLSPIFDRPEEFVIWGDTHPTTHYNGSLFVLTTGARQQVWRQFDPATSPRQAKAHGQFGSDQGWIGHCLGGGEAKFGKADGVYSYRNDIAQKGHRLPEGARLVAFHGGSDPWTMHVKADCPWVAAHYQ